MRANTVDLFEAGRVDFFEAKQMAVGNLAWNLRNLEKKSSVSDLCRTRIFLIGFLRFCLPPKLVIYDCESVYGRQQQVFFFA